MGDQSRRSPAHDLIEHAPFAVLLGLKIESAGAGEAIVRLPFNPKMLNAGGPEAPIHGGAIASLIDTAACAAIWSLPETKRSATIALTVNYTGPGISSDLIAHARVRRSGTKVASLTVDVRDTHGALVADALVTYKIS
jgi:uncharacterized protein (TIGR00369 family)